MKPNALLYALLLPAALAFSSSGRAQAVAPAPHGLTAADREALELGRPVEGWVPLTYDGGAFSPGVADRPPAPCSTLEGLDSALNASPWPGGVVPFEFDANVGTTEQNATMAAMALISPLANLTFVVRTSESAYIHVQDDTENSSSTIGYAGGVTVLRMFNWTLQATLVHELLHALGFYHEQTRPDRDSYVQIVWGNIQGGYSNNFDLQSGAALAGPYDFGSVMHYDPCAFSTCCSAGSTCSCPMGCETILALPPFAAFQSTMGQALAMSPLDQHGVRALYPESDWRFVDPSNPSPGTGTGTNPWRELSSALASAPASSRVFVMSGTYSAVGFWNQPMLLEAPFGGVAAQ